MYYSIHIIDDFIPIERKNIYLVLNIFYWNLLKYQLSISSLIRICGDKTAKICQKNGKSFRENLSKNVRCLKHISKLSRGCIKAVKNTRYGEAVKKVLKECQKSSKYVEKM